MRRVPLTASALFRLPPMDAPAAGFGLPRQTIKPSSPMVNLPFPTSRNGEVLQPELK